MNDPNPPTVKENAVEVIAAAFIMGLNNIGVQTAMLAVSLDDSIEGQGIFKAFGNSGMILNMISGFIGGLTPEDFRRLQVTMQFSPYFAKQREEAQPTKPATVN